MYIVSFIMTATIQPTPEIPAPGVQSSFEQGLINNGLDPELVQNIGAILAHFNERQETVPMSIKAGADQILLSKAEEGLENAHIDRVTGLRDSSAFWADMESYAKRLKGEAPDKRSVTILIGDLSGLKAMNDNDGLLAGDTYLRETTVALIEHSRPDDVWYRLGERSDEIVAILHGVKPDASGNYEETIQHISEKKEEQVSDHLTKVGLPVNERKLGILIAGGVLKPGMSPRELFEQVDEGLRLKKAENKAKLPKHLLYDDRMS